MHNKIEFITKPGKLRYRDESRIAKKAGPKINFIFIHGFMGAADDFTYAIDHLEKKIDLPFNVLSLDLPCHGNSINDEPSKDDSIDNIADMIHDLVMEKGWKANILVGYSMGGRIALSFAIKYPLLSKALVMESTSPGIDDEDERKAREFFDRNLFSELLKNDDQEKFKSFLHSWYKNPIFSGIQNHHGYNEMINRRLLNKPEKLQIFINHFGMGKTPSLWNRIPHIEIPSLYIVGENDRKYREIACRLEKANSSIVFGVIEGSGHNTHFQAPERFASCLNNFLRQKGLFPAISRPV
ncbi:MAG: 2-succinyl-6-hydroxy-2,4-cyclohexadiene-1-carboxylate synthase [Oligoflexales bacterium]|nr:2-succinyl-6-hydroxy-2,4-cyclohexadiene-1-carboxylate synthase [Oligoflexales bacterium]